MAFAEGRTKTEVVNEALRSFARAKRRKRLLDLRGKDRWTGDMDQLRKRRCRSLWTARCRWTIFDGRPRSRAEALPRLISNEIGIVTFSIQVASQCDLYPPDRPRKRIARGRVSLKIPKSQPSRERVPTGDFCGTLKTLIR